MLLENLVYALGPVATWIAFGVCLLVILITGPLLSRYADTIGVRTGLGGAWIGLVLIASVTSLPELATGLSAVILVGQPDLAVGAALGSCIYNLMIIALIDFIHRPGTIYGGVQYSHSLSAGFGVVLLGGVAGAVFVQQNLAPVAIGPVGPYSIAAPIIYLIAMRSVFFFGRRENETYEQDPTAAVAAMADARGRGVGQLAVRFTVTALLLVVAAIALPIVGESLAVSMGWHETFVGTIFLALATSVPEIVISVEAVRIGAVDLAIGGVLGSNLFDLVIIAVSDFAYVNGPILAAVRGDHVLTAVAALTMTGIVIVGLCSRPQARVFRLFSWVSLGLLTTGLLSALVLFLLG